MNLPEYETRATPEASWSAIVATLGGLVGLIVNRTTGDAEMAILAGSLAAGLARWLFSYALPSPKA